MYGVLAGLGTRNGSNLVSEEMEKYLEEMGIVAQRQRRGWAPQPLTSKSHERGRERLVAGAQKVSTGLQIDWSHHNRC